ncbi:MAG: cryptochrome/photolyase family protein [Actinomycetota bacterium]
MKMSEMAGTRWLFGDQLGSHFLDHPDQRVLLVESRKVFSRRRFHRAKAHLVLSAMRHRAAELGDQCRYVHAATYGQAIRQVRADEATPITVCQPTSYAAVELVNSLAGVTMVPARGFASSREQFHIWVTSRERRRLLLEDFYRDARRRLDVLMEGDQPAGGRWNFDVDNREPPPRGARQLGVPPPWWPVEDDIDAQVREDLDRWAADGDVAFVGVDFPRRFAVTHAEAREALRHFISQRLSSFGRYEDAMLADDGWMAHSLLSVPLNLGLLDPVEVVADVEVAYRSGHVPLASAEGFIRQIIGWRDYVWHLYWHQGSDYRTGNTLRAGEPLPQWFQELDADAVEARCLRTVLTQVRDYGWAHHIPRLMVLGNYALQRGWDPAALTDWFHRSFVDGYDWVMVPNVVGMSQYADGGVMATKPYAAGGAYLNRMSDFCRPCRYKPAIRLGDNACPYTAGYWAFLDRAADSLRGNHRMAQPLRNLERLGDRLEVRAQEERRGDSPP